MRSYGICIIICLVCSADDGLIRNIKETIAQHPNVGGVYDLVLNSYGPGEVDWFCSYFVARMTTVGEVHPLTKGIAVHLYEKVWH